jgi:hypothetical protein
MKRKIVGSILIPVLSFALLGAAADTSPIIKPWPTHAPEATPYVRVYNAEDFPKAEEAETVVFESIEDLWGRLYTQFGRFYARDEEYEMFRATFPRTDAARNAATYSASYPHYIHTDFCIHTCISINL